ncbi:MAG: hypothetical protein KF696_15815 [Planctomycetes bacterium]|nr:hypothetical protein [Planctomycetota bacterium]MCW8136225.1 hypothetical protein [Planctomycetota bacterium]
MADKTKAYKVLVKGELKGPFKESSLINGIRSGMLPLTAKLLDIDTGEYIDARKLVGDQKQQDYDNTIPLFDGDF